MNEVEPSPNKCMGDIGLVIPISNQMLQQINPTQALNSNLDTPIKPISIVPLPGGDEWPTSPSPIHLDEPPQLFDKGWSLDKRRKVLSKKSQSSTMPPFRSLDLDPWPPLSSSNKLPASAPLLDLNLTTFVYDTGSSDSQFGNDSLSNEISSLLKVGGEVGFEIPPDDPIVAEVINNEAPIDVEEVNNGEGVNEVS